MCWVWNCLRLTALKAIWFSSALGGKLGLYRTKSYEFERVWWGGILNGNTKHEERGY